MDQVLKDLLVTKGPKDHKVLPGLREILDQLDRQGRRVFLAHQGHLALQDHREIKDLRDLLANQVPPDSLDHRVNPDRLDRKDQLVLRVNQERLVHLEI